MKGNERSFAVSWVCFRPPRASGIGFENPGSGRICALACRPRSRPYGCSTRSDQAPDPLLRSTSLDVVSWRCHRIDTSECGPGMMLAVPVVIANCAQAGVQSSAAGVEHEYRRVERGQEDPRNRSGGSRPSGWRVARRVHLGRARSTARGALAQDRGDLRDVGGRDERGGSGQRFHAGRRRGRARRARRLLEFSSPTPRASARCSAPRSTG